MPDGQPGSDHRRRHAGCHPADLQRRVHGEPRPPGGTWNKTALVAAQKRLEAALARVESPYPATAAGLTIVVAWGLPYFRSYVPAPWKAKAPRDLQLPQANDEYQLAVLDAIGFPSDPAAWRWRTTTSRSSSAATRRADPAAAEKQLFADPSSPAYVGDLCDLTSKRIGFLGRGLRQHERGQDAGASEAGRGAPDPGPRAADDRLREHADGGARARQHPQLRDDCAA